MASSKQISFALKNGAVRRFSECFDPITGLCRIHYRFPQSPTEWVGWMDRNGMGIVSAQPSTVTLGKLADEMTVRQLMRIAYGS